MPTRPQFTREAPGAFVIGISGASGARYAKRLIGALVHAGHDAHVTITAPGRRLLHDELGLERPDLRALADLPSGADPSAPATGSGLGTAVLHNVNDIGAAIASGSFLHDGMAVVPCSSRTLAAIATGLGDNLLTRAAAVTLKERRPIVLLHRETPLSMIDIDNMRRATEAGAIVAPASPGFYHLPQTVDDLVDFMAAKVLDLLRVQHEIGERWGEKRRQAPAQRC